MCHNFEHGSIRKLLLNAPTGFNPTDGIGFLAWAARKDADNKKVFTAEVINLPRA
jgi:hypothetical protein